MIMTRRHFLQQSAAMGLLGLTPKSRNSRDTKGSISAVGKKNVLFIAVDDLRPELGCYHHPMVRSPYIDALARRGTVFERAYCQQALCAPSRASLLTGKRPDTIGIHNLSRSVRDVIPDVITLPQYFRLNGYFSAGIGKIFHNNQEDPLAYSIDHIKMADKAYISGEASRATNEQISAFYKHLPRTIFFPSTECCEVPDEAYRDGKIAVTALDMLRKSAREAKEPNPVPFFLAVGFHKPHLPFCAPKKYWDLYDRKKIPLPYPNLPENIPPIAYKNWQELRDFDDIPDTGLCDENKTRELIHGYYACVSYIDRQIGKIIEELDRLDLSRNTVIVLWGDHGWKLGEYSLWSKHSNLELDLRSPLIIVDPDFPGQKTTRALCEFVDIFPTLCDSCGLEKPADLEGYSLSDLMAQPERSWKNAAFSQYTYGKSIRGYSIRTDRFRLNEWINLSNHRLMYKELYDYDQDPLGKVNQADNPAFRTSLEKLSQQLKAGWKSALPPAS